MHAQARPALHITGWLVAGGVGILAGYLVGWGATGAHTNGWWPAVAGMAAVPYQSGFWPITDDFRIAHFGSTTQAIMRGTVIYGALIGIPCLLAAVLVPATKRRHSWPAQHAPVPDEPR